jgi:hypothetical protein
MTRDAARDLASVLHERGLGDGAALLVDAHRPLAPLIADLGAALGPLARLVGSRRVTDAIRLAEDPDGLERLRDELDRTGDDGAQGPRHAEPG